MRGMPSFSKKEEERADAFTGRSILEKSTCKSWKPGQLFP